MSNEPFCLIQSANQAMWQLQLKGLAIRLSDSRLVNSSKAPGVTQLTGEKGQSVGMIIIIMLIINYEEL